MWSKNVFFFFFKISTHPPVNYFDSETMGGVFVCDVGVVQKYRCVCPIKDHEIFQISGQCFPTGQTGSVRGDAEEQDDYRNTDRRNAWSAGFMVAFYLPYVQIHLFIRVICMNAMH